jgi:hypothetical protein
MKGIIGHWTGGHYNPSVEDREHYHFLIDGGGKTVKGKYPVSANAKIKGNAYAAHTLGANSDMIGISMACMAQAQEKPFNAGPAPMKQVQWDAMIVKMAELCKQYRIPVTPKTVLSHAEVQTNLGIKQKQKWDFTRLAFAPEIKGAKVIGDKMRAEVRALLVDTAITKPKTSTVATIAGVGGGAVGIGGSIVGASQDAQEFIWGIAPITDTVAAMSNHAATLVGAVTALIVLGFISMAAFKWLNRKE